MNGVIGGVALAALIGAMEGQIIGFSSGFKDGVTYVLVTVASVHMLTCLLWFNFMSYHSAHTQNPVTVSLSR